jgi:hypothetical protein
MKEEYEMATIHIPSDMDFNTLYYYKLGSATDASKPKGAIECK